MKYFIVLVFLNWAIFLFDGCEGRISGSYEKSLVKTESQSGKRSCEHSLNMEGLIIREDIPYLKVLHGLDEPMITVVSKDSLGRHSEEWWTYNITTDNYNFAHLNRPSNLPGKIVALDEIQSGNHHFYFAALSRTQNTEASAANYLLTEPTSTDFTQTNSKGKLSKGLVVYMKQKPNYSLDLKPQLELEQIVYGDDFGPILTFPIQTGPGLTRDCVLFTVLDEDDLSGLVYCFPPRTNNGYAEVGPSPPAQLFQKIPLNKSQLLRSMVVESKTIVIVADCTSPRNKGYRHDVHHLEHYNILNVWSHEAGNGQFILEDSISFTDDIQSIDTVVTPDNQPFLAVAVQRYLSSSSITAGVVYVYKYDITGKKFKVHQVIENLTKVQQVSFQILLHPQEVHLNILTSDALNNILIYTFDSASSTFEHECDVTSPGTKFLEPYSFAYKGEYRAQLIAVNSTQATVINVGY